jgi:nicotinamide mononucleotide adenylyltransferase
MKEANKTFEPMFLCFFRLYNIKVLIIQLLDKLEKKLGATFVVDRKDDFSVKAVKPEGYVFLAGDNMVKIVDRMEFSKNNMLYGRFAEEKEIAKPQLIVEKTIEDEIEEDVFAAMESLKKMNDGFNDDQLVEAANKMKNYIALYVGRFQPPTIAHVQNIVDLARLFKEVHVLISKSENQTPKYLIKNPLKDDERKKLLETDPKIRNLNNIKISSGPTHQIYGINSMNAETGKPIETEVKELLGIDKNETLVLAVGKEDERYGVTKQTGKFFDVNAGKKPDPQHKVGLYGIELIPDGEEGKVSATTIRDAALQGDFDTASRYIAGSDAIKDSILETLRDRLSMIQKTLSSKPVKKAKAAVKKLEEEVELEENEKLHLDEAFDFVIDILEEE